MTTRRAYYSAIGALVATLFAASSAHAEEPEPATPPLYDYDGTPREGVLSGGYFAIDLGLLAIDKSARERVGIGLGPGFDFRVGGEVWDRFIFGMGFAIYSPADNQPTSEVVVTCTTIDGQSLGCDGPASEDSTVTGSFFSFEAGVQHRFRPWLSASLTPAALLGFTTELMPPKRGVGCDGCPEAVALPVDTSGLYIAPLFRVTIGESGNYAVVARSQIFLTSDLNHFTTFGAEVGLP